MQTAEKTNHREYFVALEPGKAVGAEELLVVTKLRTLAFSLFLIVYMFPF